MRVLGLETSCDETAASVVEVDGAAGERPRGRILSDVVHTQAALHAKYGGGGPGLAPRDHLPRARPGADEALRRAGCALRGLSGLPGASGPGLVGALLGGLQSGRSLSA